MLAIIAAWRWIAGLPRILLVCVLAVALIAGGLFFTYRAGAKHEAIRAHQHALADSIDKEEIVHAITKEQTDRARGAAHTAHRFADASREKRQSLRDSVESMLRDLPKPVVDLIHLDDQQIRRDSVALVAYVAVDTALVVERKIGEELDTLRQHQAMIGVEPPRKHHGKLYAALGIGAVIGGYLLVHAAR